LTKDHQVEIVMTAFGHPTGEKHTWELFWFVLFQITKDHHMQFMVSPFGLTKRLEGVLCLRNYFFR